ncbi:MAG: LlaJI family restriction endonuclease, partial [Spirochaetales bacterium]|nr:LlaJI family restriction endonuclease [Candidatus Physcosoma equi]
MSTNLSSVLVQEQKRYTLQQLASYCRVSEERIVPVVRKLKEFGVLKTVKAKDEQHDMSELLEEDVSVADVEVGDNLYYYVFTFVGVIVVSGFVFKSYPKYLKKKDSVAELKLILKVLDKYNSQNEIVRLFNETNESKAFNLLAILLFFLQDYYENGSYRNSEVIIETNGQGEIRWDKTINETFALISNNRPYYTELQTMKRVDDDSDYFRRLHECVITKASKDLDGAGLLGLFELPEADLSDEELDDFGDKEYIL